MMPKAGGESDWRTGDVFTERMLRLVRNGVTYACGSYVYDGGRRQQFVSRMGSTVFEDCDHELGVIGHMQRMLTGFTITVSTK